MIKFLEELDGEPTLTPENDAIFDQFHAQARKGLSPSDRQFYTSVASPSPHEFVQARNSFRGQATASAHYIN